MKPKKSLVLISLIIMLAAVTSVSLLSKEKVSPAITIETAGQPTIGNENSPIHLVVFEEPKCPFCKEFSQQVYPQIKSNYIDTGAISYTLILVSFLPQSMPGVIAPLCLYHLNPDQLNPNAFFSFVEVLYDNQGDEESDWLTLPFLLDSAQKAAPKADLKEMEKCLTEERYRTEVEKNTHYARELMKGSIVTPSLYINGSRVENITYSEVSKRINQLIKKNETNGSSK